MITKAVIPAAGLGTRMLPATKAIPKGMITIVDKPALQYIVEEAAQSGITDVLIIINPEDITIERHFSLSNELMSHLVSTNKGHVADALKNISNLANVCFMKQPKPTGLGAAIYMAKAFTGDEPFAVLYSDDVIVGQTPATAELIAAYEHYSLGIAGIKEVPQHEIHKYSSLKVSPVGDRIYKISDMVEKPMSGEEFSLFSVLGRCVLPPDIYPILEGTSPGHGGEVQLTDAMKELCKKQGMIGVDFLGERFDAGNKLDLLKCSIAVGKNHPEFGREFCEYLKNCSC